jgi:hypothetical protein
MWIVYRTFTYKLNLTLPFIVRSYSFIRDSSGKFMLYEIIPSKKRIQYPTSFCYLLEIYWKESIIVKKRSMYTFFFYQNYETKDVLYLYKTTNLQRQWYTLYNTSNLAQVIADFKSNTCELYIVHLLIN